MLRMTDDSEEVFRRAAAQYPLKTDNADWHAVLKKMEEENDTAVVPIATKNKSKRWLLLLLLLIPIAVIEYKAGSFFKSEKQQHSSENKINTKTNNNANLNENNASQAENSTIPISGSGNATGNKKDFNEPVTNNKTVSAADNSSIAENNNNASNITNKSTVHKIPATSDVVNLHQQVTSTQNNLSGGRKNKKSIDIVKRKVSIGLSTLSNGTENGESIIKKSSAKTIRTKKKATISIRKAEITSAHDTEITTAETTISQTSPSGNLTGKAVIPAKETLLDSITIVTIPLVDVKKEDNIADTKKTKDKEKKKTSNKHFYAGIMAGPDFSSIKLQSVKKVGLNYGLLLGYRLNQKLSIETGIYKDKKLYSSKGKYFNSKNIPLYPGATIDYVNGECNMFEVPLNVSYRLKENKNAVFFAAAGVSAYFMQKESYSYNVNYYGTIYPYDSEYKNNEKILLAVINISAGYTHKIGKIGNLRIEPFVKLPVSKIGTGELPIQSAGLLIGITRDLW